MLLDPIRPYFALLKWLGAAALLLAAFIGGCQVNAGRLDDEKAAHKATKEHHAAVLADLKDKTAKAARLAKQASATAKAERKANDKRFDDAKHQANKARADLRAALRTGAERLHPWWDCSAGSAEGDAAAIASGQDGYAALREAGAAETVADGAWADRWIGWLQSELISTRKACGAE